MSNSDVFVSEPLDFQVFLKTGLNPCPMTSFVLSKVLIQFSNPMYNVMVLHDDKAVGGKGLDAGRLGLIKIMVAQSGSTSVRKSYTVPGLEPEVIEASTTTANLSFDPLSGLILSGKLKTMTPETVRVQNVIAIMESSCGVSLCFPQQQLARQVPLVGWYDEKEGRFVKPARNRIEVR
jgi:hypothetical protein